MKTFHELLNDIDNNSASLDSLADQAAECVRLLGGGVPAEHKCSADEPADEIHWKSLIKTERLPFTGLIESLLCAFDDQWKSLIGVGQAVNALAAGINPNIDRVEFTQDYSDIVQPDMSVTLTSIETLFGLHIAGRLLDILSVLEALNYELLGESPKKAESGDGKECKPCLLEGFDSITSRIDRHWNLCYKELKTIRGLLGAAESPKPFITVDEYQHVSVSAAPNLHGGGSGGRLRHGHGRESDNDIPGHASPSHVKGQ